MFTQKLHKGLALSLALAIAMPAQAAFPFFKRSGTSTSQTAPISHEQTTKSRYATLFSALERCCSKKAKVTLAAVTVAVVGCVYWLWNYWKKPGKDPKKDDKQVAGHEPDNSVHQVHNQSDPETQKILERGVWIARMRQLPSFKQEQTQGQSTS